MALTTVQEGAPQPFNPYYDRSKLSAVTQHAGQTEFLMTGANPLYKENEQWSAADALTKGVPITIARAGKSLYDSSIGLLTNEAGYDTDTDFQKFLDSYDASWGQYYADHQLGINISSELLASFVPGGLAVKAVKLSRAGKLGSKYLNVFSKFEDAQTNFKNKAALAAVNRGMADEVMRNTWKARGVAVADAYAEGAVISAMTYAGLNQADLFDNYSVGRFFTDTAFGGTLIAPFKYFGASKAIREGIAGAEQEYTKANFIRGSEAGTPGWQKSAAQINEAEGMQDVRAAQESRNRATQGFVKDYIDPGTTKGFVERIKERFKGITTEDFMTDFAFVKRIMPWAKGPKYDLATDKGQLGYLKSKGAIQRLSDMGGSNKATVYIVAPQGSKTKVSDIFDSEVFLNPNSAEAKAALANMQTANPGFGYELQSINVSSKRVLVPGPAKVKDSTAFKTGAIVMSSLKNLPNTTFWKDFRDLYGKTRAAAAMDDEQLLLPFRSLNIRNGKNFDGTIEPYSGDFGITFVDPSVAKVGNEVISVKDFEGLFDVEEAWKSDLMFLMKGRQAVKAERYFKLSGEQSKGLTKNSPGHFGFYENDIHALQAGYMRGDKYVNVVRDTPGGKVDTITRSELEDLIIKKKQEFLDVGMNQHGLSADDLAVRLDMDLDKVLAGDKTGFFSYTKIDDIPTYASPTHITIQYQPTLGKIRSDLLSGYDRAMAQDARSQSNWALLGPHWSGLLDVDQLTRNIDNVFTTATSQSRGVGVINFGDSHKVADFDSYASHIGGLKQQADQKLVQAFVQDIQSFMQPFLKGADDGTSAAALRLELSAAVNQVRGSADPIAFQFVGNTGRGRLINTVTGAPVVRNDISGPATDLFSKEMSSFLNAWVSANGRHFVGRANALTDVYGSGTKFNPNVVYFGPPDTRLQPNFGLVVDNITNKKSMIFASDGADLEKKIELIKQKFPSVNVYTKNDIKREKQLFDEFDQDEWFASYDFDSSLKKAGITSTLVPSTDSLVLEELQRFISKQANGLNRRAVAAYLSPEFEVLGIKAQQYDDAVLSRRGTFSRTAVGTANPFSGYMKTMLNESRLSELPWLKQMNSAAASMVSGAFEGLKKIVPWMDPKNDANLASQEIQGQLNAVAKQFGVGFDYSDTASLRTLSNYYSGNELQSFVSKYNGLLANLNLTVDFFYHISNVLSAPMLQAAEMRSLWKNLSTDPQVQKILGVSLPDGTVMPSPMKIFMSTTRRLWDQDAATIAKRTAWKDKGVIDIDSLEAIQQMRNVFNSLENPGHSQFRKKFGEMYNNTFDYLKKRTVDPVNSWIKFYAADAVDQIARAAGITDQKVIDNLAWTMTRRVGGNYISGQRPILFQGPIGHAIGLFQTFTFSVIQNLSRYAGDKDSAALKSFLTGQIGLFGANSNPVFRYASQYIAQQNPERADLQTAAYGIGEQKLGDMLVYGFPSVAFGASIYTRGDLTPINPGIIPMSLSEIPIVRSLTNYANTIGTLNQKFKTTGYFDSNTWLSGIAAANISRPLTGIVQLIQGESYDRSGNLINSQIRDFTAWTRLAGGRSFDEAKLLDRYYKTRAYETEDANRTKVLGSAIKNKLADGVEPTSEDLSEYMDQYIRAGGSYRGFNRWMQNQMLNANVDMSERLRRKVSDDPNFETWRQVLFNTEGMSEGDTPDILSNDPLAPNTQLP